MSVETNPTESLSIVSTRVFDAPPEEVYRAFSDPTRLALWWGPKGFRNTFHEFDLRHGGRWRFVMHAPNGANYDNEKEFIEVVPSKRVEFQHLGPMHRFRMTMTFDAEAEKTRLTWRMRFEPEAGGEKLRDFIAKANEENFDRLEAHLKQAN